LKWWRKRGDEEASNRRRHPENLHRPELAEKDTRLMENGGKTRSQSCEKDDKQEEKAMETMMEIFSIGVRKARVGVGYGTSDAKTLWSNVWMCSDGWNTWLEGVME